MSLGKHLFFAFLLLIFDYYSLRKQWIGGAFCTLWLGNQLITSFSHSVTPKTAPIAVGAVLWTIEKFDNIIITVLNLHVAISYVRKIETKKSFESDKSPFNWRKT